MIVKRESLNAFYGDLRFEFVDASAAPCVFRIVHFGSATD